MIICTNCGFENDPGSHFCGGCQEFLDWTGEPAERADAELEPIDDEPDEAPRFVERVVDRLRRPEDQDVDAPPPAGDGSSAAPTAMADPARAIASEAAERAQREAEEAEHGRQEAEARAREQAEATERARAHADQAERARREAEEHARREAEAAERIRAELEAARSSRQEAEEQLQQESRAADDARAETDARLQSEREAMAQAEAQLEEAEAARRAAEARATAERDAADVARQAAEEAERDRAAADAQARDEAEAADQARRAAALVARPKPTPPADAPTPAARRDAPVRKEAPETSEAIEATGPTPVKPDRSRVRPAVPRTTRQAPTRKLRPGDLVCGQCGEGNAPTRNFCRRCGSTLAEAEVVRPPWWKRLVPRRKPKVHAAGARPSRGVAGDGPEADEAAADGGGKGGGTKGVKGAVRGAQGLRRKVLGPLGKVGRILMVVGVALAAVGLTFNPGLRSSVTGGASDLFDRVRGFIAPQFEPVTPLEVTASSSLSDHPPRLAINNTSNRWWAEGSEGTGEGETLTVTFADPVDIAVVGVIPGAADSEEFVAQPRPRQLHLVFDTGVTADLDLADEHEFQTVEVDAPGVTSVQVQVIEVWQGQSGADLAITSLEFRTAQ